MNSYMILAQFFLFFFGGGTRCTSDASTSDISPFLKNIAWQKKQLGVKAYLHNFVINHPIKQYYLNFTAGSPSSTAKEFVYFQSSSYLIFSSFREFHL